MSQPLPYGIGLVDPACPIDWSHPVNRGLVAAWQAPPNSGWGGGATLRDLTKTGTQQRGTLTNGAAWTAAGGGGPGRRAFSPDGTNDYIGITPVNLPDIGAAKSIHLRLQHDGTTDRHIVFTMALGDGGAEGNAVSIELHNNGGAQTIEVALWGGSTACEAYFGPSDANVPANTWFDFVYVCDAGWANQKIYIDGIDRTFFPVTSAQAGAVGACRIGSFNNTYPDPYANRPIDCVEVWNRRLTVTEIRQVFAESKAGNPNRWRWLLKGAWFPVAQAAGGSPYSLTAGQGTYTLSGQAATLRAARTIAAAQGTYTLSGQTATLAVARTLAAGQGAYSISGQNVTLIATRTIAAGQGTYSLSGQDATLRAARTLTAASGTYTLSGQDATLTYTPAGAYTLAAGVGTYSLSGQAAGLLAARSIAAGSGTYTLSGQSVGLYAARTLLAGSGTYSLSGQAAGLTATRTLALAYGTYTLTGQAATLSYSGTVTPTTPGGTFLRLTGLSRRFHRFAALTRIFHRRTGLSRVFRRSPPNMATILVTSLPIDTNESIAYIFDFSQFDEAKAGETLSSATVPAVSGVTIGTPAVLAADTNFVPSGLGVKVTLSVASATTYDIECRGVFSGGSTRVVKGQLVGE